MNILGNFMTTLNIFSLDCTLRARYLLMDRVILGKNICKEKGKKGGEEKQWAAIQKKSRLANQTGQLQ